MPLRGTTRGYPTLRRAMHTKRLSMKRYLALLLAALVISCGGGGDGGSTGASSPGSDGGSTGAGTPGSGGGSTGGSTSGSDGDPGTLPAAGARVEESDAAVTLSGEWTNTN